jgi:cell division protein FtsL
MITDIYIGKIFFTFCILCVATFIHLFAFFSFKAKVYSKSKAVNYLKSQIKEQEKMKEAIEFQIYNSKNYFQMKDYISKSDQFKKISLSDVSFYESSVSDISNEVRI